jgi:hypothetical protein
MLHWSVPAPLRLALKEMGVWGLRPQRGPGAEPLAFLPNAIFLTAVAAGATLPRSVFQRYH